MNFIKKDIATGSFLACKLWIDSKFARKILEPLKFNFEFWSCWQVWPACGNYANSNLAKNNWNQCCRPGSIIQYNCSNCHQNQIKVDIVKQISPLYVVWWNIEMAVVITPDFQLDFYLNVCLTIVFYYTERFPASLPWQLPNYSSPHFKIVLICYCTSQIWRHSACCNIFWHSLSKNSVARWICRMNCNG